MKDQLSQLEHLKRRSLLAGVIGLLLCGAGSLSGTEQFFRSYFIGYLFWWQVTLGCLGWTMLHHLVGGNWGKVARPYFHAGIATLPLMLLLFAPIAVGLEHIYVWAEEGASARLHLSAEKRLYLGQTFVLGRAAVYFAVWIVLAAMVPRWAAALQDETDPAATRGLRRLCAGGLLLFFLTVTFAAFDWIMSLDPDWYSTIFGALVVMGAALTSMSVVLVSLRLTSSKSADAGGLDQTAIDLGNLLLAFLMLWAYFAFSQYLIIWSADQPSEITWYLHRLQGGWQWFALAFVALHFFVPFLCLLSRDVKGNLITLSRVACGLLLIHFVYVFWTVAPAFYRDGAFVHWADAAAPLGVGGIWFYVFLRKLSRK